MSETETKEPRNYVLIIVDLREHDRQWDELSKRVEKAYAEVELARRERDRWIEQRGALERELLDTVHQTKTPKEVPW